MLKKPLDGVPGLTTITKPESCLRTLRRLCAGFALVCLTAVFAAPAQAFSCDPDAPCNPPEWARMPDSGDELDSYRFHTGFVFVTPGAGLPQTEYLYRVLRGLEIFRRVVDVDQATGLYRMLYAGLAKSLRLDNNGTEEGLSVAVGSYPGTTPCGYSSDSSCDLSLGCSFGPHTALSGHLGERTSC